MKYTCVILLFVVLLFNSTLIVAEQNVSSLVFERVIYKTCPYTGNECPGPDDCPMVPRPKKKDG